MLHSIRRCLNDVIQRAVCCPICLKAPIEVSAHVTGRRANYTFFRPRMHAHETMPFCVRNKMFVPSLHAHACPHMFNCLELSTFVPTQEHVSVPFCMTKRFLCARARSHALRWITHPFYTRPMIVGGVSFMCCSVCRDNLGVGPGSRWRSTDADMAGFLRHEPPGCPKMAAE